MKVVYYLLLSIVSADIIGIAPQDQQLYKPIIENGIRKWKCLNSDIIINYDQINDDICDCPDGSDEPGTHACPQMGLKFYCANQGHFPNYINRFKVGDGVCDYDVCCDGSDEYITGSCPDKCKEVHEQYEKFKQGVTKDIELASEVQTRLIKVARETRSNVQSQLDKFQLDKQKLIDRIPVLEKQFLESKKRGNNEVLVYDKISSFTNKLSDKISNLVNLNTETIGKVDHLESILSDLLNNYNPNFNDAAVKLAVNNYQNYLSNKKESDNNDIDVLKHLSELNDHSKTIKFSSNNNGDDVKDYIDPTFSNMVHYYVESLFEFLSPPPESLESDLSSNSETLDLEIKTVKSKLTNLEKEIKLYTKDLLTNYGPNDILRAVAGEWINTRIGEYEYRIRMLDSAFQDNNHLGTFEKFDDSTNLLVYTNGQRCWNGPLRSARVNLVCGTESKILQVSEPEKCEYHIDLSSPLGCQPLSEETIRSRFKLDLGSL